MERGAKYHDFIELSEWWFNFSLSWATSNAANQVKPSEKKRVAAVDPIRSNLITHQCQTYIRWLRCFICNRYRKTDPSPLHYHNALAWIFQVRPDFLVTAKAPTVVLYKGWSWRSGQKWSTNCCIVQGSWKYAQTPSSYPV